MENSNKLTKNAFKEINSLATSGVLKNSSSAYVQMQVEKILSRTHCKRDAKVVVEEGKMIQVRFPGQAFTFITQSISK